jgi:hypothetical protein
VERSSPAHGTARRAICSRSISSAPARPGRPGHEADEQRGRGERAGGARDVQSLAAGGHDDTLEAQHLTGPQLGDPRGSVDGQIRPGDQHAATAYHVPPVRGVEGGP